MSLQNAAEFGGGVSLDQPGSGQQAGEKRLKVQQELVHDQATRPSHSPVQSRQRVGRCPREAAGRAARLLLLQALDGLSAPSAWKTVDFNTACLHSFLGQIGQTVVLTINFVGAHSPHVSLEDNAVADGGQQVVEVELVFVVAGIPATLLPRLHQSFPKPDDDNKR